MLTAAARKHLASDPVMTALISAAGPCPLQAQPGTPPFQYLVRAIVHQQLSGVVAARILARVVALYAPAPFPTPAQLLATNTECLRGAGLSAGKIRALHDLATHTESGQVPARCAELAAHDDAAIIERLTVVRGIGRWTVEMLLIFQLGRRDVLSVDDFGVRNGFRLAYGLAGLPRARALAEFGTRWAPHRSLATWYLWRAVDLAKAGRLPPPPRRRPRLELERPHPTPRRGSARAVPRKRAPSGGAGSRAQSARRRSRV
ncbi:MAG: DNA-3-methyladenine glycosylase 2 family protein [Gammaproteobacteria bacterium]|nr:DNA-3-methyladenine glycosylase 2 family protein [Gammaproteobacteria bacterium]